MLAKSVTQSNYAELQHDDPLVALCLSVVRNLPTYDGLNELDTFLDAFEREVPKNKHFQALDWALHTTPARWWGTHKGVFDD